MLIDDTGPVAQGVKDEHAKTMSDLRGLADSRQTPQQSTGTGQPLTRKMLSLWAELSLLMQIRRLPLVLLQPFQRKLLTPSTPSSLHKLTF